MASRSANSLDEIYQLSEVITEAQARIAVIRYNERKSGLTAEMMRSEQIRQLQIAIDKAELQRREKIMRYYSNWKPNASSTSTPLNPSPLPSSYHDSISRSLTPPPPRSPSTHSGSTTDHQSVDTEITKEEEIVPVKPETPEDPESSPQPMLLEENESSPDPTPPPEESKWSTEPISLEEKAYYEKCKQYQIITGMPIISISDDIFDEQTELPTASLVCVLDADASEFDEENFLTQIRTILNIDDISITKMQKGCVKVTLEVFKKVNSEQKKIEVIAVYNSLTDERLQELGKLNVLFIFMGDINALYEQQRFRNQIKLHPEWNRVYGRNGTYWEGTLQDGKDRGNQPYFCPVGWQRHSFHVSDHFDEKFKGWCICYHGTKFAHGLSILLSGLAPAKKAEHGDGIYASPSIIYTAHPRYSEVKEIKSEHEKTFFKQGKYVQFVLQCRVHPANIKKIARETLNASNYFIDPNISNDVIEWVIDEKGKPILDFNDPNSTIVCTGLMVRVTDNHPGLLPESQWWRSHLCRHLKCCSLGINMDDLLKQALTGDSCNIIRE